MTATGPDFDRMRTALMHDVQRLRARSRVRKKVGVFMGAGVLVAATTAGTLLALASTELRQNSASCFEAASVDSVVQQVGDPSADDGDRVARAIDLCASVWSIGLLGAGLDGPPPNDGQTYPVPDLFVCVQRDDTLAVFPETPGVTCDDLGLRLPE